MRYLKVFFIFVFLISFSGCATFEKAKRTDSLEKEVAALRSQVDETKKQKDAETARLLKEKEDENQRLLDEKNREIAGLKAEKEAQVKKVVEEKDTKLSELEKAKKDLEDSLSKELKDYQAKLQMTERGLVITFLAEIFFDSGRDVIKEKAKPTLQKVVDVLNRDVADSKVAVEGHTDNEPIQKSGWKSNWELSSARALAVLHYFISDGNVDPKRLSAVGYGEYHPVASNDTPEGRQQNRRVEVVILPAKMEKVKPQP